MNSEPIISQKEEQQDLNTEIKTQEIQQETKQETQETKQETKENEFFEETNKGLAFSTEEDLIEYVILHKSLYDKILTKYDEQYKINLDIDFDNLSDEEKEDIKQRIGEKIYEKTIEMFDNDEQKWGKITGMLIESIELKELNDIISSVKKLTDKILEANKFYETNINREKNINSTTETKEEPNEEPKEEHKEEPKEEPKNNTDEWETEEIDKETEDKLLSNKITITNDDDKNEDKENKDEDDNNEEDKEDKEETKIRYTKEDLDKVRNYKFDLSKVPEDNVSDFLKVIKQFKLPIPVKYLTFFLYQSINTHKRNKITAYKFYDYILDCFIKEVVRVIENNERFIIIDFLKDTLISTDEDGDKYVKYSKCVDFMIQSIFFKQLVDSDIFIDEVDSVEEIMIEKLSKRNQQKRYKY